MSAPQMSWCVGGGIAFWVAAGVAAASALALLVTPSPASEIEFSEVEIAGIVAHGPWPPALARDPSNRVSGEPEAIELGRRLFFDTRLSAPGTVSCASCHKPELGWTDGRTRGGGIARLDRNTQTVLDAGFNRWFGWDGRNDSLWAHSLGPILDPREMGADEAHVARLLASDPVLAPMYREVFAGPADSHDPQTAVVNAAKALAAFQETLVSPRTAFDDFRDALERGDGAAVARFPAAAQRGARIFVGRGKCNLCHLGPAFTNGEFADVGVPYFIEPGRVDPGRHGGIARLRASPYNRLGRHNDSTDPQVSWATRHVTAPHSSFGEFKVPTLRGLTRTEPYMHNGSKATLTDVVRHYSEIDLERLHADGERILKPLGLTDQELGDLVAFLKTLSP